VLHYAKFFVVGSQTDVSLPLWITRSESAETSN